MPAQSSLLSRQTQRWEEQPLASMRYLQESPGWLPRATPKAMARKGQAWKLPLWAEGSQAPGSCGEAPQPNGLKEPAAVEGQLAWHVTPTQSRRQLQGQGPWMSTGSPGARGRHRLLERGSPGADWPGCGAEERGENGAYSDKLLI